MGKVKTMSITTMLSCYYQLFNATHFGFFYNTIMDSTKALQGLSYTMHKLYHNHTAEISALQCIKWTPKQEKLYM